MKQTWQDYNTCLKQMRSATGAASMQGTITNLIVYSGFYRSRVSETPKPSPEFDSLLTDLGKFTTILIDHHENAKKISEKAERVIQELAQFAARRIENDPEDRIMWRQVERLKSLSEQLEDQLTMFVDVIEKTLEMEIEVSS